MKNKMDDLLREKINNLDTVPPGVSLDKEASWEKIKNNQKAIARKTDFVKKAALGIILAAILTGGFLFYSFEGSEEVRKAERTTYISPATEKTAMQSEEESVLVYVKPDPVERKTSPQKTIAPRTVPVDTSMKVIVPITTIKPSADKQKKPDTVKIPRAPARYPSLIGNTLEGDFSPVIAQQGENLVQNGTFEQGNVGFKSDFRFLPQEAFVVVNTPMVGGTFYGPANQQVPGAQQIIGTPVIAGSYIITDSFSQKNPTTIYYDSSGFLSRSDSLGSFIPMVQKAVNPVPSTGSFLAVNINISGKQRIWYKSITVKPNTTYSFSCILANVSSQFYNGAFKLCVNGEKVSKVLDLPGTNEWRTLSGMFTSGPDQTRIEISIEDIQSPVLNNLVALDNIVFKEIPSGAFKKKKERFTK
jgi:hypothetical protein